MARDLIGELRQLLTSSLRLPQAPESIAADAELFGGTLGLDSLDAVQFITAIEKQFSVALSDADLARNPLSSLTSVAELLRSKGVH